MANGTRRANGDAAPYKNEKLGRWELFIELPRDESGKRRRKQITGRTAAEVRKKAKAVEGDIARTGTAQDDALTIKSLMAMWLETIPGTVADGTVEVYRRTNRLYIEPKLGRKKAAQLQPREVTAWLNGLTGAEGQALSAGTKRQARAVLRRALRWAENEGMVNRNAAAIAQGPRGRAKEVEPLSIDQVRDLLAAVDGYRLQAAVVVMLTCGLRSGEAFGLTWGDLELDATPPLLHVRQQLQRRSGTDGGTAGLELVEPKTAGSRRTIAVPKLAVDALKAHRRAQAQERLALGAGKAGDSDLVFSTVLGTPVDARNFSRELKRLGTDAGIEGVHPHRLRHSAVAVLLDAGVPLEAVSETVGHSSIRTTKDIYGKLLDTGRARVADAMDGALG